MHPFSVYNSEAVNDYPIIIVSGDISVLEDEDYREQINDSLSDATEQTFGYPQEGIDEISAVLKDYDMELPEVSIDDTGGELIFALGQFVEELAGPQPPSVEDLEETSDLYLYIYYEYDENQKYHFFAELVDDDGLSDLLEADDSES